MKKLKEVTSNLLFCLKLLFKADKKTTIILFFSNLLIAVIPFFSLYINKCIINDIWQIVIIGNSNNLMLKLIFILVLFAITQIVSTFFQSYINKLNDIQQQQLLSYINIETMKKSVCIDISCFDIASDFDELNKSRENAHSLHQIIFVTSNIVTSLLTLTTNIILSFEVNPIVGVIVMIFALPKNIFKFRLEKETYKFEKKQQKKVRYMNYLNSLLFDKQSAKENRLFNTGNYFIEKYLNTQNELMKERNNFINKKSLKSFFLELPQFILEMLIKIIVACKIFVGEFTLGDYTYINGIFDNLSYSIDSLMNSISAFCGYNERINDFKKYFMCRESLVKNGSITLKKIESIVFKNVSFSYPNSDETLKNVSFEIKNKEKCMLVGMNGCGKTTILKLLTRFYDPQQGNIFINGIPIYAYEINSLRSNIAMVFQDFNVFSFTIRENIAVGNFAAIDDDLLLRKSLEKSCFDNVDYVKNNNLDAYINKDFEESGIILSGGQQQKIAIARAAVRDSQLIILDEPTAWMDPIAENEILDIYNEIYKTKTVLMVSHRLSAAIKMDKIIFIENGRISSVGSHKELYYKDSNYKKMFDLQSKKYK